MTLLFTHCFNFYRTIVTGYVCAVSTYEKRSRPVEVYWGLGGQRPNPDSNARQNFRIANTC